jgi:hypothetical protein
MAQRHHHSERDAGRHHCGSCRQHAAIGSTLDIVNNDLLLWLSFPLHDDLFRPQTQPTSTATPTGVPSPATPVVFEPSHGLHADLAN